MRNEKDKIIRLELLLLFSLLICTLFHLIPNKIQLSVLFIGISLFVSLLLKRERTLKVQKKKITKIMIAFALLYVGLFYMFGLYTGFTRTGQTFSFHTLIDSIIPMIVIILTTERIRDKFLQNNSNFSKILIVGINTIIEIMIYLSVYKIDNLNNMLSLIGFVSFTAIANHLMYNYIGDSYGKTPVVVYRLITTLYLFIIPFESNIYIYYRTFLRVIYPLIIFLYIEKYYSDGYLQVRKKDLKREMFSLGLTFMFLTAFILLISGKFYYGVLVIGSNSMKGTINKGDIIVYQKSKDVKLEDVIVFQKEKIKIVHRVVDVKNINKEQRFFTKGDANPQKDDNYVTNNNYIGKVLFRIKYVGEPTLWLKNIFK